MYKGYALIIVGLIAFCFSLNSVFDNFRQWNNYLEFIPDIICMFRGLEIIFKKT